MKKFFVLFFLILFSLSVAAQKKPVKKPAPQPTATPVADEKTELDKAVAQTDAAQRIEALQKFAASFPQSAEKPRALELVAASRAEIADGKMRAGDAAGGVALFKSAIENLPVPVSDKFFADVVLQIPTSVYFRGERAAAAELARAIETKAEGNPKQLLALATFYLGIESADEAKRLAGKALVLDSNLPAAYQTLGLANRLNFNLEEAADSYSKALELDQNSTVSKRSLAEMKRALGKSDEAAALYREITEKNPADAVAANGLILSLFDAGKKDEAESLMMKSLEANPNNLILLAGAAYQYAAHNDAARAVELASKAIAVEPRYVWSYIALARGYLRQNKIYDAEKALLAARAYGNFPTLDYELAAVRAAGGFYREAAEELAKSFVVRDDSISGRLGGRVERQTKSFIQLVAFERRASIFEPLAADDPESAQRLKSLLDFYQKTESPDAPATDAEIADAAEKFVYDAGDDGMRLHRRLFAADRLLKKRKAVKEVGDLMKSATPELEAALNVPNPSSAVLADELYTSRQMTIAKNQLIIVPEVQRQTLSNVLRGRIEEINGEMFLQSNDAPDAVVRLRRALSVLPEKSAWWRSSQWRLGTALEADGKADEALTAYIKSYVSEPLIDQTKRAVIESLYRKINGSLDGLDARIGANINSSENFLTAQKTEAAKKTATAPQPVAEAKSSPTETVAETTAPPPVEPALSAPAEEKSAENEKEKSAKKSDAPTETAPDDASAKTEPKQAETDKTGKIETSSAETKPAGAKQPETFADPSKKEKDDAAAKSIFEPVIINVPKVEKTAPKNPEEKSREDAPEKSSTGTVNVSRPRVVVSEGGSNTGGAKCELAFSQESVSLINNGGSLGILVGLSGDGDAKEIRAQSSSPADVAVSLEPEIGAASNSAYFVFKSTSARTGIYTVTFEAACGGTKEFIVKVR